MIAHRRWVAPILALALAFPPPLAAGSENRVSSGEELAATTQRPNRAVGMLRHWNQIAVDMSGLDHTPVAPGDPRTFGEQLGPGRSSRAVAIAQIAVFEAVNAVTGGYRSYTGLAPSPRNTSIEAAMAQA